MKIKLFFLSLGLFTLTSCKIVKSGTAKSIDISGVGVVHKPVIADLEINQKKIRKTIVHKNVTSMANAQDNLIRETLSEHQADLLIEPKFESKTQNGKTELTVTGWLAYYKNFRPIEEKDLNLIEVRPAIIHGVEKTQSGLLEKIKK